jgi:hypothetical protein
MPAAAISDNRAWLSVSGRSSVRLPACGRSLRCIEDTTARRKPTLRNQLADCSKFDTIDGSCH